MQRNDHVCVSIWEMKVILQLATKLQNWIYSINLNTLSPRLPPDGSACGIPTVPCSVPIEVGAATAEDRKRRTFNKCNLKNTCICLMIMCEKDGQIPCNYTEKATWIVPEVFYVILNQRCFVYCKYCNSEHTEKYPAGLLVSFSVLLSFTNACSDQGVRS